jgi:predicted metalloendopeptidase
MELGRETVQTMADLSFTFTKAVYGVAEPEYRSRKCANQVNRLLGFAISSKYVQTNFDENSKADVTPLFLKEYLPKNCKRFVSI